MLHSVTHAPRRASMIAMAIIGMVATLAVSAPAVASQKGSGSMAAVPLAGAADCPSHYACFWPNAGFRGNMGKVAGNNPDFRELSNSASSCSKGGWQDCISSVKNNGTQCTVYFFKDISYRDAGGYHSLGLGDSVSDLSSSTSGYKDPSFNDSISSNSWCTTNP